MRAGTTLFILMICLLLMPSLAFAEFPSKSAYVGGSAGANLVVGDWEFGEFDDVTEEPISPSSSFLLKIRAGFHVFSWLAIELDFGWIPFKAGDEIRHALMFEGDIIIPFWDGVIMPFADVGIGMYLNPKEESGDSDFEFHFGLGARYMLTERLALRADVRHVLTDTLYSELAISSANIEIMVGVDYAFWVDKPVKSNDTDNDGVTDDVDACPSIPGELITKGCPDKDGDGIADGEDTCPEQAGDPITGGCPDMDGDEIIDSEDDCPEVYGAATYKGCPAPLPEELENFLGVLEGIKFKTGSAEIESESFPILSEASQILLKYPYLRVRIEGHTDSRGDEDNNMDLSRRRAQAVKNFLVDEGVLADRLEAEGYGDTQPIGDNETPDGRSRNRRIEFIIVE